MMAFKTGLTDRALYFFVILSIFIFLILGSCFDGHSYNRKADSHVIENKTLVSSAEETKKFGGIVGTAYDCSGKPLPFAHLILNRMPTSLSRKDAISHPYLITFFITPASVHIQADSIGNYLFDDLELGYYQVVLDPVPPLYANTISLSHDGKKIDSIQIDSDSNALLHVDPFPFGALPPQDFPCSQSAVDFIRIRPDSCAILNMYPLDSWSEELKTVRILILEYKPC